VSLYLLHIEPRYKHAGHYLGWTPDPRVNRRAMEHIDGVRGKASPLILAALNAGCTVVIARRWEGPQYDKKAERAKKHRGHTPLCPLCRQRMQAGHTEGGAR
jgi:hypothetical protein